MGEIQRVGIVGSGIMGAGLAEVAAKAGFDVVVRSRRRAGADDVVAGVTSNLQRQVDKGRLEAADMEATVAR
ncbi:MAG: 3-hydroxyacyl-CoA dehydrogenase NAD-binding domain-containing protein, partial [Ilumatobacteraceae bacterium]